MPCQFNHRRNVDEYESKPFLGLTYRNLAFGSVSLVVVAASSAGVYLSGLNPIVMCASSFALILVCGPLLYCGFRRPKDGYDSFEQKAVAYAKWWFSARNMTFVNDTVFDDAEREQDERFRKSAAKNARREREQR